MLFGFTILVISALALVAVFANPSERSTVRDVLCNEEEHGEVSLLQHTAAKSISERWQPFARWRHPAEPDGDSTDDAATGEAVAVDTSTSSSGIDVACTAVEPADTRILLLTIVQAKHGTAGLEELLMSSEKVSTLCAGESWQCEGSALIHASLLKEKGWLEDSNPLKWFSQYWNDGRQVLHERLFPDQEQYMTAIRNSVSKVNSEMPDALADLGVKTVKPVYAIMWTPLCVRKLSNDTHLPDAESEVSTLEKLKEQHAALIEKNEPVIVISYADLLWRTDETVARLQKFLPCVGTLDADYVPVLGRDVFPENKFKARGSVRKFGESNDPTSCCGFDVMMHSCTDQSLFKELGPLEEKMKGLHAYFESYTRDQSFLQH